MDFGDVTGSSTFQLAYPILNTLLAASGNRGALAAHALNQGMGISNQYAAQRKADEQNALLRQKLGDIFKSTTDTPAATLPGATTNLGLASEEAAGLQGLNEPKEATAGTPSFASIAPQPTTVAPATSKPAFTPAQQKLGEALSQANRPDLALGLIEKMMDRQRKLTQVRPGGALVDEEGNVTYQAPAAPVRQPTPPRPVIGEHGTMIPTQDPNTGQWTWPEKPTASLAAPARAISPEQKALEEAKLKTEQARPGLIGAQTGAANAQATAARARADRLATLAKTASDPKTTTGQASAAMNALIRERDSIETPEEDKPIINDAIRAVRTRLAEIGRNPNGAPGAAPPPKVKLDDKTAQKLLKDAGGDKAKARQLAITRGYEIGQ